MENEIINYLSKHVWLSDEMKELILKTSIVKSFDKGTVLLREGEMADTGYWVLKGGIRSYIIDDAGEEKTLEFYLEEQTVIPVNYGKGIPADHFLACFEASVLLVNTVEHERRMFEQYPKFESVCRIMGEVMMANLQASFVNYKLTSPEDRYLFLLKNRPELIRRVPQYQLASYLGIKPESLSRMKKRLHRKA